MDVLKDSHDAEIKRIKAEKKGSHEACEDKLERCEKNLEEEKKDGDKKITNVQKKCDKDTYEETRHHKKEVKKLTERGKEINDLLEETIKTIEFHKQRSYDYKVELQKCRDENNCEGTD